MADLPSLLSPLAIGITTVLALIAGVSSCLSVWIIPLMSHAPPRVRIRQFKHMTDLGFKYLQTGSRIITFLLFVFTVATYRDNTGVLAKDMWKWSATALLIMLPLAPYEILVIFPINGRVKDIGDEIDAVGAPNREKVEAKYDTEITRLFRDWQWDNGVRSVTPFVASVILALGRSLVIRQPEELSADDGFRGRCVLFCLHIHVARSDGQLQGFSMDTLHGTSWDVIIAGTGLQESLLGLALSRSGKKILHIDKNAYYGGSEAALSLQEAEEWRDANAATNEKISDIISSGNAGSGTRPIHTSTRYTTPFRNVQIDVLTDESHDGSPKLSFPRAYSLALAPHIIYAQSAIIPTLVSSKVDQQLEFLVLGSWWTYRKSKVGNEMPENETQQADLKRVPNGREDLFADQSIGLKDKRSLMKFLRFVGEDSSDSELLRENTSIPFKDFLETHFKLSQTMQQPIHALAMSSKNGVNTSTEESLLRIRRHLHSIGIFGQGFGAVVPKWGGLAEMAQVGCRACAVGGGVYVLGTGLAEITPFQPVGADDSTYPTPPTPISVKLSSGDVVNAEWVVSGEDNLPLPIGRPAESNDSNTIFSRPAPEVLSRSISIISSSLRTLFPKTGEGSPIPAGAIIVFPPTELDTSIVGRDANTIPPIHVIAHSSDTGECPKGQCVLYSNVALPSAKGFSILQQATDRLLSNLTDPSSPIPKVLWRMQYEQHASMTIPGTSKASCPTSPQIEDHVITFPHPQLDLIFDDSVLERVQDAWKLVMGEGANDFMMFERREGADDGADDGL